MRIRSYLLLVAITALFVATASLPPLASAATKSMQKEYGEPKDDKALAYFIRTKRMVSALVPFFLYVDDELLGVVANNCYTYTYLDPGERVLWNGRGTINRQFEFEPGKTYYFSVWDQLLDLPQEEGQRLIEKVKSYCLPSDQEIQIAEVHIAKAAPAKKDESLLTQRPNENFIRAYEGILRNENEVAKVVQSGRSTLALTGVDDIRVRLKPTQDVSSFWVKRIQFQHLEVLPGSHWFSVELEHKRTFEKREIRANGTVYWEKTVTRSDEGMVEFTAEAGHVYSIFCRWKGVSDRQINYDNAEMWVLGSCEWMVDDYTAGLGLVPDRGELFKPPSWGTKGESPFFSLNVWICEQYAPDLWTNARRWDRDMQDEWMARQKQAPGDAQSFAAAQQPPSHDAAKKGTKEQVVPLLTEGANVDVQTEENVTPSHAAATGQKAAVALGSTSAQDVSPTSDASRLQDLLRGWNFHADVCLHDVNGDGVDNFLVVHNAGVGPNVIPAPPPGTTAEGAKMWQQGIVKSQFSMAALDGVLDVKKKAQDWQVDLIYLQIFDDLYEFPLSEYAHCSGSLKDHDYRSCLMRGFFNREQTDEYPTLPSCSQHKMP